MKNDDDEDGFDTSPPGLSKLDDATLSVDILTKELVVKEKELGQANIKADKVFGGGGGGRGREGEGGGGRGREGEGGGGRGREGEGGGGRGRERREC